MKTPFCSLILFSTLFVPSCTKETPATPGTPPANVKPAEPTPAAKMPAEAPATTPTPTPAPVVAAKPAEPTPPAAATPVAVPTLAELPKLLAGITNSATATSAKAPLEALVQQLQTQKAAAAPAAKTDTLGGLGKLATEAAAKVGLSPELTKQIGTLLENPEVKAVLGQTLEKLQGLMK